MNKHSPMIQPKPTCATCASPCRDKEYVQQIPIADIDVTPWSMQADPAANDSVQQELTLTESRRQGRIIEPQGIEQMDVNTFFEMSDSDRRRWYLNKLGKFQNQINESAVNNKVPPQLIATIILNELADIKQTDVYQQKVGMQVGSLGMAQIQVETAIKDGLVLFPCDSQQLDQEAQKRYELELFRSMSLQGGPMPKESLRKQAEREMVSHRLTIPQYAIESAAREIRVLLNEMVIHRANPWQQRFGLSLTDVSQLMSPNDIYNYIYGNSQLAKEQNLSEMIAAAYNSPEIIKASKKESITRDADGFIYDCALQHGNNARDIAANLCITSGTPVSQYRWECNWAGEIYFNGQAEIYKHHEGGPFVASYDGQLFQALGKLILYIQSKDIVKDVLIRLRIMELDESIGELVESEGVSAVTDDMLPVLSVTKVRLFSETLCRLQNDFNEDTRKLYEDFISQFIEQSVLDWSDYQNLPSGLLLAKGDGEVKLELNFETLTSDMLDAHFRYPRDIGFPLTIDLRVGWYLDYSKVF
ncbi:MAG: hypothetical protein HY957_04165, partial [Nitrospirae bacterium]|nr:hypothetical protein [Nitrospirota bacterium]